MIYIYIYWWYIVRIHILSCLGGSVSDVSNIPSFWIHQEILVKMPCLVGVVCRNQGLIVKSTPKSEVQFWLLADYQHGDRGWTWARNYVISWDFWCDISFRWTGNSLLAQELAWCFDSLWCVVTATPTEGTCYAEVPAQGCSRRRVWCSSLEMVNEFGSRNWGPKNLQRWMMSF